MRPKEQCHLSHRVRLLTSQSHLLAAYNVYGCYTQRRKMETEGKARVVASVWVAEFIKFLCRAIAGLPRSIWKNMILERLGPRAFEYTVSKNRSLCKSVIRCKISLYRTSSHLQLHNVKRWAFKIKYRKLTHPTELYYIFVFPPLA